MNDHQAIPASPAVRDDPVLTELELKRLAQLLNVLMEVDFHLSRSGQESNDD